MTAGIIALITLVLGFVAKYIYRVWNESDNETPEQKLEKDKLSIEVNYAKNDDKAISVDINDRLGRIERLRDEVSSSGQQESDNIRASSKSADSDGK